MAVVLAGPRLLPPLLAARRCRRGRAAGEAARRGACRPRHDRLPDLRHAAALQSLGFEDEEDPEDRRVSWTGRQQHELKQS